MNDLGVVAISILGLGTLGLTIYFQDQMVRRDLVLITGLGLLYRLLLLAVSSMLLLSAGDGFAYQDDRTYHTIAGVLLDAWISGSEARIEDLRYQATKNQAYYFLLTSLYYAFGYSIWVGKLFGIFLSLCSLLLIHRIARSLWGVAVAKKAALIYAFLPDLAIWSTLLFKDSIVCFLVLLAAQSYIEISKRGLVTGWLLVFTTALGAVFFFRAESMGIFSVALALARIKNVKTLLAGIPIVATGFLAFLVLANTAGLDISLFFGGPLIAKMLDSTYIDTSNIFLEMLNYTGNLTTGGLLSLGFIFGLGDLWRLPLAMFFSLFVPFPFWPSGINTANDIFAVATIPWSVVLLPAALYSVGMALKTRNIIERGFLIYLICQWIALSVFIHALSPIRHRVELIPFFIMFLAAYFPWKSKTGLSILTSYGIMVAILSFWYVF